MIEEKAKTIRELQVGTLPAGYLFGPPIQWVPLEEAQKLEAKITEANKILNMLPGVKRDLLDNNRLNLYGTVESFEKWFLRLRKCLAGEQTNEQR